MRFFFRQTTLAAMPVHVGADSLKKPHDIITLSFSEFFFQVEGQAKCILSAKHMKYGLICKKSYIYRHVVRSGILRPNTTNTDARLPLHPQFIKHTINHLLVLGFLVCTFMLDRQHYIYKHTMAWDRNYILSKLKDRNCFASEKHVNFCIMLHMIFILHI